MLEAWIKDVVFEMLLLFQVQHLAMRSFSLQIDIIRFSSITDDMILIMLTYIIRTLLVLTGLIMTLATVALFQREGFNF